MGHHEYQPPTEKGPFETTGEDLDPVIVKASTADWLRSNFDNHWGAVIGPSNGRPHFVTVADFMGVGDCFLEQTQFFQVFNHRLPDLLGI